MKRISLILILFFIAILGRAQYGNYLQLTVVELLQYQQQKLRKMPTVEPFKRYGLRRIMATKYLDNNDLRHIWGWHLQPNEQYQSSEPLYKLFRKTDESSLAVIDTQGGSTEVVFWDKAYYRRFAQQLRNIGIVVGNSQTASNVLQFRKVRVAVHVDVTIWPDVYILKVE